MAGLYAPLSTLRRHPRGYRRMTRGQCGSLDLHCERLALSAPCRSSRRTRSQDFPQSRLYAKEIANELARTGFISLTVVTADQRFATGTFQMSAAYSAIVRSDENQPTRAMFSAAARPHASGCRH